MEYDPGQEYATKVAPLHRGPCGKACYRSEQAAKRGRASMDTVGKGQGYKGRTHVYFCRPCRAFHVGHA
jgi:hypothetical protein